MVKLTQPLKTATFLKTLLEIFGFLDECDYEYEIFSKPSSARAWTSVILAGKRDSHRHSTEVFNYT